MTIQSRWTVPVPEVSVHKYVFGSPFGQLPDFRVYLDADAPDSRFLSFSDYRLLSKRFAVGLQKAGLKPGDRVLLFTGNSIYFPVMFMGIMMAGGIFTGASPAFGPRELAHQLKDSGAQFAVVGLPSLPVALEAGQHAGFSSDRIYAFDYQQHAGDRTKLGGVQHWSDLLAPVREASLFRWLEPDNPRTTTCCLNYSSGTTGLPKGVEITHYAYVANGETCRFLANLQPDQTGPTEGKASIGFMPLYHAAGQTTVVVNNPKMGTPTYIMSAFNFEKLLQHVQDYKITSIGSAPPVMLAFAKSPLVAKYDLSSLREVVCGTAPLAPEVAEEVEKRLWPNGDSFIRQGWGMTEVTCTGALWSPDDTKKTNSVGELVPNARGRIMDGDKEVTEPNKHGELWFSSPTLFKGYWKNQKATEDTVVIDEDGTRWMKTGDLVYVDRYGPGAKIYIVDRLKELIKVRGFQVAPSELEGILLDREDVIDSGVVGVQINGDEVPRAYIVKDPKSTATEQDIVKWMEGRVAKYKWLRGGVVFVDSIPRIQSGKIMRRVLRERARQEVASPKAKLA